MAKLIELGEVDCLLHYDRYWLVVSNIFIFQIYGIILPIDFHIFQDGWNHQPGYIYSEWGETKQLGLIIMPKDSEFHPGMAKSQSTPWRTYDTCQVFDQCIVQDGAPVRLLSWFITIITIVYDTYNYIKIGL